MDKEPEFELKITGEYLLDHNGIDWIRLYCPHCGAYARFNAKHTIVVPEESLDLWGDTRHFHTLAACEFCNDVIYVKCFDFDSNPDWHFSYEYHYPKSIESHLNLDTVNMPVSFSEARIRLQKGDYLATVAICRKILKNLFIENGISEKITFSSALKKIASDLKLPDPSEISSLTEDFLFLLNKINLKADYIKDINDEDAEKIYELAGKVADIIKNREEIRAKQIVILNSKSEAADAQDIEDIDDIPF